MSIFKTPTLGNISSRFEGVRNRLGWSSRLPPKHQRQRRLSLDPLEERQLLSVSPADYTDVLINETVSEDQITLTSTNQYGSTGWDTAESMAMDDDGDFVVTWTRYDPVYDESGQSVVDPVTGEIMRDANVYARYFTDEVQRITIPDELVVDNDDGSYGAFYAKYGGNEVQKLTVSATTEPYYSDSGSGISSYGYQQNIAGEITLGFDVNGSGGISADETVTVIYDETDLMAENAGTLQMALQGLGGALADATVEPVSPTEFEIHFGDLSNGEDQPLVTVESANFSSGFLPAVELEALREPVVLGPIYVSPDEPSLTALSIETAFLWTATEFDIGPYEFPPSDYVNEYNNSLGPYAEPETVRESVPGVSVDLVYETVVDPATGESVLQASATEFEITFDGALGGEEGAAGKIDHPELELIAAVDEAGAAVDIASLGTVETLKETSAEFRVNPEEEELIFTAYPDKYDQSDAVVAMDADGDFIIVWESESAEAGDDTDVYARLFTPVGLNAPDNVEYVEGIMAKTDAFLVNTQETAGMQGDPSVDMDSQGNFTIAWASGGQDLSYYNNVYAKSYHRDGDALASEYRVNSETTAINFNPVVSISDDGYVLITWGLTNDESYILNLSIASSVQATIVDSSGNTLIDQFSVPGGVRQQAAWDKNGNFLITWDEAGADDDNTSTADSNGVHAAMWNLSYDSATDGYSTTVLLPEFAVNSASFDVDRTATWPYWQGCPTPGLDADGDLTIAYEGFGADVSDDVYIRYDFYAEASADPANADLLAFFNNGFILSNAGSYFDIDLAIELELISAANLGATDEQLGRIRAILDEKATLLRGEANGILYTQIDAAADGDTILYSDNVANAERDGSDQRWLMLIDSRSTSGSFVVRLYNPYVAGYEDVTISPVYTNSVLNVSQTQNAIENALEGAMRTGLNWPESSYEGSVTVRTVSNAEIQDREVALEDGSQPWAYTNRYSLTTLQNTAVYEITFQGEAHDTGLSMYVNSESLEPDENDYVSVSLYQDGDAGTTQSLSTLAMEPDGDYALTWLQYEEYTSDADGGNYGYEGTANQNLYYRRFDESTDTAGPYVTDLVDETGNPVDNGETIEGAVSHLVVTFDEEMLVVDPDDDSASVLNADNWILTQDGVAIPGAIVKVEFGMNKASELSGTDDGIGGTYGLSNIPTNKWEAVITIDADGSAGGGMTALGIGYYEIIALSTLEDTMGNALGADGTYASGFNMARSFSVSVDQADGEVDEAAGTTNLTSATLQPETANAVAVDDDGDYVVVWTAYDSSAAGDRVYMRMFDADGTPADLPIVDSSGAAIGVSVDAAPVMLVTADSAYANDTQRYASVAMDPDGDFVVTWTNYHGDDADIYARHFSASPLVVVIDSSTGLETITFADDVQDAFRVNEYTDDNQKWSDVALDVDGDFVVTWASYAQEQSGESGTGYGIYARRYDSEGTALAKEYQVNVTTAGNQTTPSIAMAGSGTFVIAWTSDQNGTDDDIIVREFNADGSAVAGSFSGERLVNDTVEGHQRYPDVAMRLDGESYVVTWTDTAADVSGTSVWAELSSAQAKTYVDPVSHQINSTHEFNITIDESYSVADVNVQLGRLYHTALETLTVTLTHGGVSVTLFDGLEGYDSSGAVMNQTTLDDEAASGVRIDDTAAGAAAPYVDIYIPQGSLSAFDGLDASGTWTLTVTDNAAGDGNTGYLEATSTQVGSWGVQITESTQTPDSFIVNSTTAGHQMYSSVAMDTTGDFVITWSGNGAGSSSTSGHDVHYQRFDEGGAKIGSETLVNLETDGDQWISSVGMDAIGNFVIVWTGEGTLPGTGSLYKYDSNKYLIQSDDAGPIVTDMYSGADRIFQGGVIEANDGEVAEVTVVFNEEPSVAGGEEGLYSVLNPDNWSLACNGVEIAGGISSVEFGLNPLTDKWEAVVTFDGNGVHFGTPGLDQGTYTLTVRDMVADSSVYIEDDDSSIVPGEFLDGDRDGQPGTQSYLIGVGGYEHEFSIAAGAQNGPEFRVNEDDTVAYVQQISEAGGLGQALEETNQAVAVDHDGDFAVVWTTDGLDAPSEVSAGGVYLRLYNRDNNAVTNEILVNETTEGDQSNASIAMDADGDFVVVWQSENADGTYDIYARLFDSTGNALTGEFRVNSTTNDNQVNPSVAMDDRGGFVITWATSGQDFSYFNDVYAQRYDRFGVAQGSEFMVNTNNLAGTSLTPGAFEINPVVAVSDTTGDFAIAWEVVVSQTNGVTTNTMIAGRLYDSNGAAQTDEIQLDSGAGTGGTATHRVARNPQLAMNDQGGFFLVWESYNGTDYDVHYSEFNSSGGTVVTGQANMSQFAGQQVNPSIAVDADGDFSIVWNGAGATADPLNPSDPDLQVDEDASGVFKIDYNAANQTVGTQTRVNYTEYGDQYMATIAMEPDGDSIVVWSGVGVGDTHGIFARRYDEGIDTAGPTVSDWADQHSNSLDDGHVFEEEDGAPHYIVLTFDEDMLQTGDDSVTNPQNYALLLDGIELDGAIVSVEYGLNMASQLAGTIDSRTGEAYSFDPDPTNKYEAIVTFDSDLTTEGLQGLEDGTYTLRALAAVPGVHSGLRDAAGNVLYLTGLQTSGNDFSAPFMVNSDGDDDLEAPEPPELTEAEFNAVDLDAILVNQVTSDHQYTTAAQSVATDNDGDFVVTWTRYDSVDDDGNPTDANIYARYYTDEVQRISLPDALSSDTDDSSNTLGEFALEYNAAEIQQLSITAGIEPSTSDDSDDDEVGGIEGSFVLGFDLTGDGTIGDDPSVQETVTIRSFVESEMEENAASIQSALRSLGGELEGVIVQAVDPRTYQIAFADQTAGLDVPEITAESFQFSQSYLPAVSISTLREGLRFENIAVSEDDPWETAAAIEAAIAGVSESYLSIAPITFPSAEDAAENAATGTSSSYESPWWTQSYSPEVEVTPVIGADGMYSLTEFDITFVGSAGKQDHPQLVVTDARDDQGSAVTIPAGTVETRKEPSNEFRVNPEEEDGEELNQTYATVAMDADGDFVIAWQSEVSSTDNYGSVTDVYARRFSPFGTVDGSVEVEGELLDIFGESSGVRAVINPEAEDVQRLIFDADDPNATLTGMFRLQVGDAITEPITMDSNDLAATADDIEAKLADAGIEGVTVVRVATTTAGRYRLDVRFSGESAGVDQPLLEYVSDTTPLAANVTVEDMNVDLHTIAVNQDTANPQFEPTVSMDDGGNFVVAWANGGQLLSYFNHVSVQRFDSNGERAGNEFQVNTETTSIQYSPYVELSDSGNFLVTWSTTSDSDYQSGNVLNSQVYAKVFDASGNQLVDEFVVGTGGYSAAAFDSDDNYIITWEGLFDTDAGTTNSGVHAAEYALYDESGQLNSTATEIRPEFRVNSASTSLTSSTLWPYDQSTAQPAIDADGDLIVIYEGYGPDVSVNVDMAAGYFAELMGKASNADLLQFFDPFDVYDRGQEGVPVAMITDLLESTGDVDDTIDQVLFRATGVGASDPQLGRLRAILEESIGQLRGEANGILVSTWDADPELNTVLTATSSDCVINSYRDGQNQSAFIEIPVQYNAADGVWYQAESGTFTVQVTNVSTGAVEAAAVTIASNGMGQQLNITGTLQNLEAALEGMAILGSTWDGEEGTIDIREVEPEEIESRLGTDWEIDGLNEALYEERAGGVDLVDGYRNVLYEVVFQGSAHDTAFEIEVISSDTERGGITYDDNGNPVTSWVTGPAVSDAIEGDTYGLSGTLQTSPSIDIEPDGDYVAVYTQVESYLHAGFVADDSGTANSNIYYRRFDEQTDTAGPQITDFAGGSGTTIEDDAELQENVQYVVITFDEEMLAGDPEAVAGSVLNTANYILYESGAEVSGGVLNVSFGLSKAAELSGEIDPLTGEAYDLDAIPSNKWEAVITLDSNPDVAGAQPLQDGHYAIQVLSTASTATSNDTLGLRDKSGNTLYRTGYDSDGDDYSRSFSISVTERTDEPVSDDSPSSSILENGHTDAESSGAIAADADGQYVVVWTATDPTQNNLNKVYYRLYDADGSPADLPVVDSETGIAFLDANGAPIVIQDAYPVLPVTTSSSVPGFDDLATATQSNATVAMDEDGDFVVTWTNYLDGNADIYARQFDSMGELAGVTEIGSYVFQGGSNNTSAVSDAFPVNSYTDSEQKWSDVAVDVDGDFVITWSSLGQEDGGDQGTGYGVYARRYDSYGYTLGSEFQVNLTEAGDQRFSSVAMDSEGRFVVAWASDQNGVSDDIVIREYNADGTPTAGPLSGEVVANQTLSGDQTYPDVAMNLSGDQYVVTWASSGQDGSGWGVYSRLFNRADSTLYVTSETDVEIPDTGSATATLNVSNNAVITDLNVQIELSHDAPSDLTAEIISPDGTVVELFSSVPSVYSNGTLSTGSNISGATLDDEAAIAITDADNGAVPPFAGTYQPTGNLAAFDGENVNGQWQLRITDSNGNDRSGLLGQWTLIVEQAPTTEDEFRVNTTSVGNQSYPSVAMDHQGEFVVTWSGFGNQTEHDDMSGSGVFLQRYEATGERIGSESRVNMSTEGDQKYSSVATDGVGNYCIAFTGVARDSSGASLIGQTDVFVQTSSGSLILVDNDPPIVAEVRLDDGTRLLEGDVIAASTGSLAVVLSESMSTTGMTSVENVSNWSLKRNGNELPDAIESVEFEWNELTRKYEATVSFVDDLLPLAEGEYQLLLNSVVTDGANALDGDRDGIAGSDPATTTQPGYQFDFIVSNSSTGATVGAESRVNTETMYVDQFSTPEGTGTALETTSATLAVDHDGDYAVVWTRYGSDDPNDSTGAGVYMRLYNRDDEPLTDEILVNTITAGNQQNPSVAIDADGDLVVAWESENSSQDGSYDVYARRFNSVGEALDSTEFLVNTETTLNQVNPSVAMDDSGNFVIVWATAGEDFGFSNDIQGQLYNSRGEAQGQEFLVNDQSLAGISPPADGSFEINPSVSMSGASGDFVVTWEVVTSQQNGVVTDTVIAARQFTADGSPVAAEFQADTGVGTGGAEVERVARNAQVVVGDDNSFVIVWESHTGTDYDVFYQTFDSVGAALTSGQVNMAQFAGQQVNPSVAVDVDGNFGIVFNGAGAEPNALYPNDATLYADEDDEGVWVRSYDSTSTAVSVESRVNVTSGGIQQFPTIAMEPDGDYVVAWSGQGVGDHYGIFVRRYDQSVDLVGPQVTELRLTDGTIVDDEETVPRPTELVVVFDEDMLNSGEDAVTNPENWILLRDGVEMPDSTVSSITYSLNPATNKYEAVFHFDGYLPAGDYTLTGVAPVPDIPETDDVEGNSGLRDAAGNAVQATGSLPSGADDILSFRINTDLGLSSDGTGVVLPANFSVTRTDGDSAEPDATNAQLFSEIRGSVATDADGDHIVVLTATDDSGTDRLYYRQFDPAGNPTSDLIPVLAGDTNASDFTGDIQENATVAVDADGDFIITWTNVREGDADIFARRFAADGQALGDAFQVNTYTDDNQVWSSVAMDADGDFIVTWSSYAQELNGQQGSGYGVYARRYDSTGVALASEFQVNVTESGNQRHSVVDMDSEGGFVVVWQSDQGSLGDEIMARVFNSDGSAIASPNSGEITVNDTSTGNQRFPDVAIASDGDDFIVTWTSSYSNDDTSGTSVYGQLINIPLLDQTDTTLAKSGEFLVNSTTTGDQCYSVVDMNNQGNFVIAWQGRGDIEGEESEKDDQGIYFQQFDVNLDRIGGETRANADPELTQVYPSIDADSAGNFVLVWQTQAGQDPSEVYRLLSDDVLSVEDDDGPWVTDVLLADGSRVIEGDVLPVPTSESGGVSQLRVLFSEDLSVRVGADGTPESGPDSVLNPANWGLECNSSVVEGAITDVDFGFNESLNKWEAVLTLDGNGTSADTTELPAGDYVLTVLDNITDKYDYDLVSDDGDYFLGNRLDGDYDGVPGTSPDSTGYSGYKLQFSVSEDAQLGPETRVNEVVTGDPAYVQVFGPNLGTGQAQEESRQSVAVDHDGDFAVVWTSYGQDDASDDSGAGVYLRLYDSDNNAQTSEILVNQTVVGDQRNASIAMDADGDFVVVWEAEGTSDDGSWDVYGRCFDSIGNPIGDEFLVNQETANDQVNPSVSMDYWGNFVVVWASSQGESSGYFNDIWGRLYDLEGQPTTGDFQVNDTQISAQSPSPGVASTNPSVAMAPNGNFAVAWDQITAQTNGVITDSQIVAKYFDSQGTDLVSEFQVDDGSGTGGGDAFRTARNPQVGLDENGNMTVVWEAYGADDVGVTSSYGVFFQQFEVLIVEDIDLTVPSTVTVTSGTSGQVNLADFAGEQVNPGVGVDADGDFTVVWNGAGGESSPLDPTNSDLFGNLDTEGVWLRNYDPLATPSSGQYCVNMTTEGVQNYPAIAMEPDGDYVVVWQGKGVGDQHGVFARQYDTAGDSAGPLATELRTATGDQISEGESLFNNPATLTVVFNEEMSTSGGTTGYNSVENANNWALVDGQGNELVGAVSEIDFSLNSATNKWEAVLTFNTAIYPNGLENGYYTLVARTQLNDLAGNSLAMTGLRPSGTGLTYVPATSPTGGMGFSFRVHELTPGDPNSGDLDPVVNTTEFTDAVDSAVARNSDGRYVVVWVEDVGVETVDPTDLDSTVITYSTDIYARMFDANDEPISNRLGSDDAFLVNSPTTGDQVTPDVAIDGEGNFVVVWAGVGISGLGEQDDAGVFGQLFDANGDSVGGQFGINQTADGIQSSPAVAMDDGGDYVVSWESHEQGGIMARKFDASGASTGEFLVNSTTGSSHKTPDVAIDNQGDFAVTWAADQQDGGSFGVFAQRYSADAAKVGDEFQVNQFETNQQETPRIAMSDDGAFVITWQSFGQDASGGYGIYARRYDANGNSASGEFQVNDYTTSYQFEPAVAMDSNGDFVITWSSFGQEGDGGEQYGIFAKMYNADGSLFVVPGETTPVGEFRINAIVEGDQRDSDVSMDAAGHYVVVWEGTSTQTLIVASEVVTIEQSDIYARFVDPPATLSDDGTVLNLTGTPDQDTFEFIAGASPGSWLITVNGETYSAASTVDTINFDGMGGDDIVILTGTSGVEEVYTRPGEVAFEGANFTVNATDVEDVAVDGKGGTDVAELRDSAGDDSLVMEVGKTTMTGAGYSNTIVGFEEVYAYATSGGIDEAKLYDTDGNEVFTATPEYVRMEGDGFMHRAKGFRYAHGYSSGGADVAVMHDSAGDDKFKHYQGQSKMFGAGFYVRAKNFPEVDAIADGGGDDYARIFDTSSVDKFVGTPTMSRMYSTQADYDVTAELFELTLAKSINGGNDIARFYDSDDKEIFLGTADKAEFSGDDFEIIARKFEKVEATATPGTGDIAKLRDTEGDEHLVADADSTKLYSKDGEEMELLYEVFAFDQVKTYRSDGNDTTDVADAVDYLLLDDGWLDG
jgi:subtilisin-like proprotein convertase family protein